MNSLRNLVRQSSIAQCILLPLFVVIFGCTELIDFQIEDFEDVLVIDATITDENKQQEIFISRTFLFGEQVLQETGAMVQVTDNSVIRSGLLNRYPAPMFRILSLAQKWAAPIFLRSNWRMENLMFPIPRGSWPMPN